MFRSLSISLGLRLFTVLLSFLFTPLILGHLGKEGYGLWVLFSTILGWTGLLNFGVPNALRNGFAALSKSGQANEANFLISSAFGLLGLIGLLITTGLAVFAFSIDFENFFKLNIVNNSVALELAFIVVVAFGLNIYFSAVNSLYFSIDKPEYVFLSGMFVPLLMCLSALLFGYFELYDLRLVFFILCACILLPNILGYFIFFGFSKFRFPGFGNWRFAVIKKLFPSSAEFFLIQIAFVVLFTSDKVIISFLFGPEELATYDIFLKIYSPFLLFSSVLGTLVWGRFARLWNEPNTNVNKSLRYLIAGSLVSIFFVTVYSIFIEDILRIWMKDKIDFSSDLVVALLIFVILRIWTETFSSFFNGINKLKIQRNLAIVQALINIPLSIGLGMSLGVSGVVWATSMSMAISAAVLPFAAFKELRRRNEDWCC